MQIAITGYSGFVASHFRKNTNVSVDHFYALKRDESDENWIDLIKKSDAIINLAGAPVIQRWNKKNRTNILESRINTTRRVVSILNQLNDGKKRVLISASAIGIYPDKGDDIHDEHSSNLGSGFLADVVKQWEAEAELLDNPNVRKVIARIGVVVGMDGGLLKQTLPIFKIGLGGKIASGKQSMSFIHIDDLVKAFDFMITKNNYVGIYNMVTPKLTTNADFTKTLAETLQKQAFFTVPAFALKLKFGQAANMMIEGEKVYPERLLQDGFEFDYPTIEGTLKSILSK